MLYPNFSRAIGGYLLFQSTSGRSSYIIRNYRGDLIRLQDWLGDIAIDKLKPDQLEKFMVYLKNDFIFTRIATTPIPPKKLSVKLLSNAHCALKVFRK